MTKRLIEEWLPIAELGIESVRERTPMTPFPAPNRLHVWWARRPLVASRAAVLASLLPADADHEKFMHVLGIHGDPIASRRRIDLARQKGERFDGEAYSYPRAFLHNLNEADREWLVSEQANLGLVQPSVLDPTAGGGSIPFEALRTGCKVYANDLNPVAVLIQRATYEWPAKYGPILLDEFNRLKEEFLKRREERLAFYFPPEPEPNAIPTNYLWARTITCPYCDGLIPLSPNWRLAPDGTGVKLLPQLCNGPGSPGRICEFEVVNNVKAQSEGVITRGNATCPYPDCRRVIQNAEIKAEAMAGRMGEQLFAIVYKKRITTTTKTGKKRKKWERGYRSPYLQDEISNKIQDVLEEKIPEWEALDLIPIETLPLDTESWGHGNTPAQYGARNYQDLFSPRQLLCHGISVEIFIELLEEEKTKGELSDTALAAITFLSMSLDKLRDYNSRMTRWHNKRQVMVNTFDRHDFALKWSYAEMPPLTAGLGYDWAFEQTAKCIQELLELTAPETSDSHSDLPLFQNTAAPSSDFSDLITITCQSGDDLNHLDDGSVDAVVLDPPYYDNVMYAELSDFFYVWLKRTA
jgi:putative DNA methylase